MAHRVHRMLWSNSVVEAKVFNFESGHHTCLPIQGEHECVSVKRLAGFGCPNQCPRDPARRVTLRHWPVRFFSRLFNCLGSDLFNDSEWLARWEIGCVIVKASCLTCEPTYMIVPNLARTCDGSVIVSRSAVKWLARELRSLGCFPFDNTMRPRIGDQWGEWCAEK